MPGAASQLNFKTVFEGLGGALSTMENAMSNFPHGEVGATSSLMTQALAKNPFSVESSAYVPTTSIPPIPKYSPFDKPSPM